MELGMAAVVFGNRALDFHGRSLVLCTKMEQAIDTGDISHYSHDVVELVKAIRYAEESHFLNDCLNSLCDKIDALYLRTGLFAEDNLSVLLAYTLSLFNTALRYQRSAEIFTARGWNDANNHSFYRRTFAESWLGMGHSEVSADCGVQYYTVPEILGEVGENAYQRIVQPIIDKLSSVDFNYNQGIDKLFLLSMNGDYFERFGVAQALSIIANLPQEDKAILFIIFDPTPNTVVYLDKLNTYGIHINAVFFELPIFEEVLDRNTYLASIRFCVVHWLLSTFGFTLVVTDADQLFAKQAVIVPDGVPTTADISLFDHTLTSPYASLYAKYGASYVEFYPNRRTFSYSKILANFLAANLLARSCWTLDQIALLYCKNRCPDLRVNLIDNTKISCDQGAALWNQAGPTKFEENAFTTKIKALFNEIL